jgi:hypothetical protein
MATVIHNANAHGPIVFQRFCLGGGGDGFDFGRFQDEFCFHDRLGWVKEREHTCREQGDYHCPRHISPTKNPCNTARLGSGTLDKA